MTSVTAPWLDQSHEVGSAPDSDGNRLHDVQVPFQYELCAGG